jgi:hypothetical protein
LSTRASLSFAALGVVWVATAFAAPAFCEPLMLKCTGEIAPERNAPAARTSFSFETDVPFGEGNFLALSNPETGKVEKLVYPMEVLTGSFRQERAPPEEIVWTLATSKRGEFVGQVVRSDGQILSLTIASAPKDSAERPFLLFDTAAGSLYRGSCL